MYVVSNEEVCSYFQSGNPQLQPSFNFIPIWLPEFDKNYNVLYKNQALNVYSNETPFIDADYINEKSLFESPDTTNLISNLNVLPANVQYQNDALNNSMNHKASSAHILKSSLLQDSYANNYSKSGPNQLDVIHNLQSLTNSRPTEFFFTDSTDYLTWDALVSGLINSIDRCIACLKDQDKLNFNEALNQASNNLSLYHIAGRLIREQLEESNKLIKFSLIIKKITNMFIQFRIWSSLAVFSIDRQESAKSNTALKDHNIKTDETAVNKYIENSITYRHKLEKLSLYLTDLVASLSYINENGVAVRNTSKILPMLYSRFLRDKFEGGNFKNKFVDVKNQNTQHLELNKAQSNILLDDDIVSKLKVSEKSILSICKEMNDILTTNVSEHKSLKTFNNDRNLKLLTAVYQLIPQLASFLNFVESIDLTVFVMIDRMAAQSTDTSTTRHNTLVSQGKKGSTAISSQPMNSNVDSVSSIMSNGVQPSLHTEGLNYMNDELDNSSQSFYDATANLFRPMIHEFLYLKQLIHIVFTDIILDSQTLTAEDPETFFPIRKEKSKTGNVTRLKMFTDSIVKKLEQMNFAINHDEIYSTEPALKLIETLKLSKERITLLIASIIQLKEERTSILNYCSRLMNSDFNIASLFIAERHNTLISKNSQVTTSGKSTSTFYSSEVPSEPTFPNSNSMRQDSNNYEHLLTVNDMDGTYECANLTSSDIKNLPWYMQPDRDEEELIFEATTLKGGPVRGLVSRLVNPLNLPDELFEETFLCFFSTFVKPVKLFELLIEKYHLNMPEALSYEEYGIWLEEKLKPQQNKVLEIFEKLFSKFWIVNYTNTELIDIWETFVDESSVDTPLIELASKALSFEKQQDYIDYFKLGNSEAKHIPMSKLNSHILHIKLQALNMDYVAEQITAVQAFYYRKLNLWDLLGRSYNFGKLFRKKNEKITNVRDGLGTKNVAIFIKNCNNLTHYATFMILKHQDLGNRISAIVYFIQLAEKLMKLKNFSSMTAIISGLSSTSVSRLRKTWDGVPQKFIDKFHKMDNLMSIGKNYKEYRNILKFVETDGDAYLPFLGMYLSDLRFTTDGNSDWLTSKRGSKGIVNFSKRRNILRIIREVMDFNNNLYDIKLDTDFSRYLHEMFSELPDEEKLYELSLEIEPRVSLLKHSMDASSAGVAHNGSVSSTNFSSLTGAFNVDNVFGSFSAFNSGDGNTNSFSRKKEHSNNHTARKQKRYRPLISMPAFEKDKDKEREDSYEQEKSKEKEKEKSVSEDAKQRQENEHEKETTVDKAMDNRSG